MKCERLEPHEQQILTHTNAAYGKIILVGEHFVVYDLPAVVTALELVTTAHLDQTNNTEFTIIDQRPKVPTFKPRKTAEYHAMIQTVFTTLGVEPAGWTVTLSGTLPVTNGGIGASAAAAVAVARAVNTTCNLNLSDAQINEAAFCGEHATHGTPSGIDNTAATYGGTFTFQKGQPRQTLTSTPRLHLVLADSGRPTNIKHVINALSALGTQNATAIAHAFEQYLTIFGEAQTACATGNMPALGQAMTNNHKLLATLGLSSPEQDYLVDLALNAGALGAKITGTGCGGLIVALAATQDHQKIITNAIVQAGFFALATTPLPHHHAHHAPQHSRQSDTF